MFVKSNQPAAHIYTGNWLDGTIEGKYGEKYAQRSCVCVEPEIIPNHIQDMIIRPGDEYQWQTEYTFK